MQNFHLPYPEDVRKNKSLLALGKNGTLCALGLYGTVLKMGSWPGYLELRPESARGEPGKCSIELPLDPRFLRILAATLNSLADELEPRTAPSMAAAAKSTNPPLA